MQYLVLEIMWHNTICVLVYTKMLWLLTVAAFGHNELCLRFIWKLWSHAKVSVMWWPLAAKKLFLAVLANVVTLFTLNISLINKMTRVLCWVCYVLTIVADGHHSSLWPEQSPQNVIGLREGIGSCRPSDFVVAEGQKIYKFKKKLSL